jgi:hypothetical protein
MIARKLKLYVLAPTVCSADNSSYPIPASDTGRAGGVAIMAGARRTMAARSGHWKVLRLWGAASTTREIERRTSEKESYTRAAFKRAARRMMKFEPLAPCKFIATTWLFEVTYVL